SMPGVRRQDGEDHEPQLVPAQRWRLVPRPLWLGLLEHRQPEYGFRDEEGRGEDRRRQEGRGREASGGARDALRGAAGRAKGAQERRYVRRCCEAVVSSAVSSMASLRARSNETPLRSCLR